jgi:NAD(P)-dependent dehydrogenase (short-subunit alcohol dehydrogenase family)
VSSSPFVAARADTISNPLFAGGVVAYRLSKAALNELTAIQSREYNAEHTAATAPGAKPTGAAVPPITTVVAVHPGMVDTDMLNSGFASAPESLKALTKSFIITPKTSAEGIYKLSNDIGTKPNALATFVDYTGKPIAW